MINDYELIFLIRSNQDVENNFNILQKKYEGLIVKNIDFYNALTKFDDYYQEALIVLSNCVNNFDESKNKTFTRYFEMHLKWKFYSLNKERNKYVFSENIDYKFVTKEKPSISIDVSILSKFELEIFELKFEENMPLHTIALTTNKPLRTIQNCIYRIKEKLKKCN